MRRPSGRPRFLAGVLLPVVFFGAALSYIELAASPAGPETSQSSESAALTNLGVFPSVQLASTSFVAAVGVGLTIRFNVTTYQPGTLYWSITNGTEPAFLTLFQVELGQAALPGDVTASYPDGISSNGSSNNVPAILTFDPSTVGKTFPLQLVVWLVPKSDPQHPIATAESMAVTVGPDSQTPLSPLTLVGAAVVAAVVVVAVVELLWYRKKAAVRPVPVAV